MRLGVEFLLHVYTLIGAQTGALHMLCISHLRFAPEIKQHKGKRDTEGGKTKQ